MTPLPWWPVVALDIGGAALALGLGVLCAVVARRLKERHGEDVFVAYLWAFTLVVLVFVASRSVGHIAKQALLLADRRDVWAELAPLSGAINTATFVAAFVISASFGVMVRLKQRVRRSAAEAAEARARADEVRAEMQRLHAVFEGVDACIYVCGADQRVLYCNRRLRQIFPAARVGSRCDELFCPTPADGRGAEGDPRALPGARFETHVTEEKRVMSVSSIPIEWTDRSRARLVAAFDVTELRRAQEQLRQTQKMEALGTLAGGIAHDFNNILSAVVGYGELAMLEAEPGTTLHDYVGHIRQAADRARELVKRILTFAREGEHELRPLELKPILSEALGLLRATLPTTLELRTSFDSRAVVEADPTRIHQVIVNLCTNAAAAIGERPGLLEVSLDDLYLDENFVAAHPALSAGPHVRLRVTDDGCGMAPEVRERVFEPFFTTRASGEGTGLGLSVVHGIVTACRGVVTVYSEPGVGTTFTVFLPVAEELADTVAVRPEAPLGAGESVLFVDDEVANGELARAMLGHLGYRVTVTASSEGALDRFRSSPEAYDIVITDLTMPRLRGDELARAIRAIRPDVPILLTTGYSAARAREWRSGGGRILSKPFSMAEIASAVRGCLGDAGAGPRPT